LRAWIAFAVAFGWFSFRAAGAWLASGYVDPVGHFGAQDEAFYTRVVIEMLRRGNWLTPTLLDRIAYFKPPLLYWLSGLSVSILGPSRYAFRVPSLLAGAGICAIVFHWMERERGPYIAALAACALLTDGYLIMLSSVNMMDALATFFALLALWTLTIDPQLAEGRNLFLCAFALTAGILTKSVAGLVPVIAIVGVWMIADRDRRPRVGRAALLAAVTAALTAPWFVYTMLTHGRWFWREHVLTEILSGATGAGPLSTGDSNLAFYAQRFFLGDPITALLCCGGLVFALVRRRSDERALTWLIITAITLLVFRQHAATYLLPAIVAGVIVFGSALPDLSRWVTAACIIALLLCQGVYLFEMSPMVWTSTNNAEAQSLTAYCDLQRGNGAFLVAPGDEYASAVLPLPRVHYGMADQGRAAVHQPIDWRSLGVIVTAEQFAHEDYWWPVFRQRLTGFGLDPALDPRATMVLLPPDPDARKVIAQHPELDFFVPESWIGDRGDHDPWAESDGRVWLLSRKSVPRQPQQFAERPWACGL
jgi:hypothetical protein